MIEYNVARLRFYGDLIDFLDDRSGAVERTFDISPSVKDMIESCGVPHPEVDLVLVDGEPVDWDHRVTHGEAIAVFPRFRTMDVGLLSPVHVTLPPEPRFVLDGHLSRLGRYLRLLGIDSEVPDEAGDAALAERANGEGRILLTRDVELLKRRVVRLGYFVRAVDPLLQCVEVMEAFDLASATTPYSRCMACNGALVASQHDDVVDELPPRVRGRDGRFDRCERCSRVYWQGSHHAQFERILDTVMRLAAQRSQA